MTGDRPNDQLLCAEVLSEYSKNCYFSSERITKFYSDLSLVDHRRQQ